MDKVTVEKKTLLETVRKNRSEHRNIFLRACEGYREEAIATLDKFLADAKAGKRIHQYIGLEEPVDKTKDYDRVIKMLEMSVADTIELTVAEFAQYVMDDWSWKGQFTATNTKYIK